MKSSSIFPILALLVLAACGGGDENDFAARRAAEPAREEAITLDMPAEAPPAAAPASGTVLAAAQPQFSAADTGVIPPPQPGPEQPAVSLNPMLIRTGTATVEVDSLEQGLAQVRALAQRLGGIV
ncbi:MAG TPA: hypothetical protein VFR37_06195, partial [Longimicrobium sp.]|nr:hypothetical protein [Longimicrobium sp.]